MVILNRLPQKYKSSKTLFIVPLRLKIPFYAPISSEIYITMLTAQKNLFLQHIFVDTLEKSHGKKSKSNGGLASALVHT